MADLKRWVQLRIKGDEYLKFERVKVKRSSRPDLHGLLLLDELFPSSNDMVIDATSAEIYLDVTKDQAVSLTDEQVIELIRCGILLNEDGRLCLMV